MAVKEIKDMGASVLARLKKQSKEIGVNFQVCLQLFAQEEFLRKLELSSYVENFVLKGGMFLYTISKFEGRPTMDIDFMLRRLSNEIVSIESVIGEVCSVNTGNDFITMEVTGSREITPEKKYPGIGITLMAHIKNVRIPFSIDIGVDDVIVPEAIQRKVSVRLEDFKEPCVYTYSLESTLAEKFEAIIKRMTATSRMKDFYDIYYWSQAFEYEGKLIKEAVYKTMEHRNTPYERDVMKKIKTFANNEFLLRQWQNYYPGPGIDKPEFVDVLNQIEMFFGPIFQAIIRNEEFDKDWLPSENVWKVK